MYVWHNCRIFIGVGSIGVMEVCVGRRIKVGELRRGRRDIGENSRM